MAPEFRRFAEAGAALMKLHIRAVGDCERSEPGGRCGIYCPAGGAGGYRFRGDGPAGEGGGCVGD